MEPETRRPPLVVEVTLTAETRAALLLLAALYRKRADKVPKKIGGANTAPYISWRVRALWQEAAELAERMAAI